MAEIVGSDLSEGHSFLRWPVQNGGLVWYPKNVAEVAARREAVNMLKTSHLEWGPEYFRQLHTSSVDIAKKYNLDISKKAIIASQASDFRYDRDRWLKDEKLKSAVPLIDTLEKSGVPLASYENELYELILATRSASIGAVRGHRLNKLVADICREAGWAVTTEVKKDVASEKVDVVAKSKSGAVVNFMIQVGLWEGGQQSNRANGYLSNENIVCVVYNEYVQPGNRSKQGKRLEKLLFDAYKENRLIWVGQLPNFLERRS